MLQDTRLSRQGSQLRPPGAHPRLSRSTSAARTLRTTTSDSAVQALLADVMQQFQPPPGRNAQALPPAHPRAGQHQLQRVLTQSGAAFNDAGLQRQTTPQPHDLLELAGSITLAPWGQAASLSSRALQARASADAGSDEMLTGRRSLERRQVETAGADLMKHVIIVLGAACTLTSCRSIQQLTAGAHMTGGFGPLPLLLSIDR